MIKPHGSDELNPLYVQDDAARAALTAEAETLPSVVISSAGAAKDDAPSAGQDVADTLNDAQQRAKDVEATLEEKKKALDEELDEADD